MNNEPEKLQIGDVFTSPSLANANYDYDSSAGKASPDRLNTRPPEQITRVWTEHAEDGWKRERRELVDVAGYDASRGSAEFVVIGTGMTGGGLGHGCNDVYPDGWEVTAKRLTADGKFDPEGEQVSFYQSGCFAGILKDVTKTRRIDPFESGLGKGASE